MAQSFGALNPKGPPCSNLYSNPGAQTQTPTRGTPSMARHTSITWLGWDWHQRPARSLVPRTLKQKEPRKLLPSVFKNNLLAPTWLNGGSQTSLVVETSLVS